MSVVGEVKTSGLRWLAAMLLVEGPWAGRILALPFLTILAPSKRFYEGQPHSPKTLLDWARQAVLQIRHWLPDRKIILVADTAFAAIEFLVAVHHHASVVTRLRLDAALYDVPPPKRSGRGRPAIKGKRLPGLAKVLEDPETSWLRSRHPQNHPSPLRSLLHRHPLDARPDASAGDSPKNSRLVCKNHPHLQRRHRRRPTRNLEPPDFLYVPVPGRDS